MVDDGWVTGSAISELQDDEYAYIVVDVPPNTSRLDIVLTWDEPPSDTIGRTVIADIDLYFGPDSNCDPTDCAEYSSTSRIDNVEYLVIDNPSEGRQRISIVPHSVYQHKPRAAVAWQAITGNSTPAITMTTDKNTLDLRRTRRPRLELSLESDSYVASGGSLYFACRAENEVNCDYWYSEESVWQPGSRVEREDGTYQDLTGISARLPVHVGELSSEATTVELVFPPSMKTADHQLTLQAVAANANAANTVLDVVVDDDGSLPDLPSLISNDNFRDAEELSGESGTTEVHLVSATREPGEYFLDWYLLPALGNLGIADFNEGLHPTRSAWYFVESDTIARLHLTVSDKLPDFGSAYMEVMTTQNQSFLDSLRVAISDSHEDQFMMDPKKRYYIRLVSIGRIYPTSFTLEWSQLNAIPENDHFANRTRISGEEGDTIGNNLFATTERGEPAGDKAFHSTWYTWTAPEDAAEDTWRFSIDGTGHSILVYEGSELENLRLVSDPTALSVVVPIEEGVTYQVAVITWWHEEPGKYKLTWDTTTASQLADNDLYEHSAEIVGESGTARSILVDGFRYSRSSRDQRTVEANEPLSATSHSQWWNWTAPSEGQYTWRLTRGSRNQLSFFEGSSLDDLELQNSGTEFVVNADAEETYSIALHRKLGYSYDFDRSTSIFEWGLTPDNDRIAGAAGLEGDSGSATFSLKFATSTLDETANQGIHSTGVKSSVWASWTAPEEFDGWMAFYVDSWEDKGLSDRSEQYFLGIHKSSVQEGKYELIASTDRTYIGSGLPAAQFKPQPAAEYLVQIALRNNGTSYSEDESTVSVSWEPTNSPAWLTFANSASDFGSNDGSDLEELYDPRALVAIDVDSSDPSRLLLSAEAGLVVLGLDDSENFVVEEVFDDQDNDERELSEVISTVMRWDPHREAVYFARSDGIGLLEGLNQSTRELSVCGSEDDFTMVPQGLVFDPAGKYIYKVGNGVLAMYRMDGPCTLTPLAAMSASSMNHDLSTRNFLLSGLTSVSIDNDGSHLYGVSEDWLLTFSIDREEETLSLATYTSNWVWQNTLDLSSLFESATTLADSSGEYLFVADTFNPSIAVFDIGTDSDFPSALAGTDRYYIDSFDYFPSHLRKPRGDWYEYWNQGGCQVAGLHSANHVAIDVFCDRRYFVAKWDPDREKLLISDWSTDMQSDRFGNPLPDIAYQSLSRARSTVSRDGRYAYIFKNGDMIDPIYQFERVSGPSIDTNFVEPFDEYIVRLVALDVSPGEFSLGGSTFTDCEAISNYMINGVSHTIETSKWQSRTELGAEWTDVEGTTQESQICPYSPPDNAEYRLAFEASIDGVSGNYSSNTMSVPEE